ncbi:dopamine receptor 4-like [Saccostrea echinata]|uniref:dopamine receptor 4-like n=1 Tax=Saccostrea echinata TaxID=191078 RepID=UPI002A830A11|nr:dopamine receptor 4-like [Saccostrea echinata]
MLQENIWDLNRITFVISTSIYIILGTIGNALIIAVYVSKKRHFPRRTYILTLAITDLVVMILVAPYTIVFELRLVTNNFVCHVFEVVRHSVIGYSNLILILIAMERLLMVWKPLKVMKGRTKLAWIIGFLIFTIVCSSPSALIYDVDFHGDPLPVNETHVQEKYCDYTTGILGEENSNMYRNFIIVLIVSELMILIVIYTLVFVLIYRQRKSILGRAYVGSTRSNRRRNKSTIQEEVRKQDSNENKTRKKGDKNSNDDNIYCITNTLSLSSSRETDYKSTAVNVEQKPNLKESEDTEKEECKSNTAEQKNDTTQFVVQDCQSCNLKKTVVTREATPNTGELSLTTAGNGDQKTTDLDVVQLTCSLQNTPRSSLTSISNAGDQDIVTSARKMSIVQTKTWTMLSICTFLYIVCWIPFFPEMFNVTEVLALRFFFFIGHASNPIIYSVVNVKIRRAIKELLFGRSRQMSMNKSSRESV